MIKIKTSNIGIENGLTYISGNLGNGHFENEDGAQFWFKDGLIQYISDNRIKRWYKDGELHRVGGPAVIWGDGTKEWFQNGQYYRDDDLPHIEYTNGERMWAFGNEWYNTLEKYILAKTMT